ncbi:hypothetical protein PIB30_018668 [Stylosanthes scabra]|uniref:RNase H type-1 domain-containing protein n=1 Tax=Stylosanthes scabra TaxID=79078 RepID=A0ABU6V665_9FABA|nr:hypothetical protein [Stylosanthes scabra]
MIHNIESEGVLGQGWRQWCMYKEEVSRYVVGGYFREERGAVKVWMGEEVEANNQGEAYLEGIESAVQFLLEDLSIRDENTVIYLDRKNFVAWINGGHECCWENRFLRNKLYASSIPTLLDGNAEGDR